MAQIYKKLSVKLNKRLKRKKKKKVKKIKNYTVNIAKLCFS